MLKVKYWAGIGSRSTPKEIGRLMTQVATKLESQGYVLRSGGAEGADSYFEEGIVNPKNKEIYLPWAGFNNKVGIVALKEQFLAADKLAEKFHSNWAALKQGGRKLISRDGFQVLGLDLKTPSKFIICYTKDGGETGGTGQALRISKHYNVPIFNLYFPEVKSRLEKFVES